MVGFLNHYLGCSKTVFSVTLSEVNGLKRLK
jgi:hypothetical protein